MMSHMCLLSMGRFVLEHVNDMSICAYDLRVDLYSPNGSILRMVGLFFLIFSLSLFTTPVIHT
jgi:hypothetical protein